MKISDFPVITIPTGGTYRLISEKLLVDLLTATTPETDPSDTPEKQFGQLVKRFRVSSGDTQPGLAERLQASEKTVRNLESGRRGSRNGKVIDSLMEVFGEVFRQEAAALGYSPSGATE